MAIRVDDQNIPDMPEDFDGTEAEWVEQYSSEEGLKAEVDAEEFIPEEGEKGTTEEEGPVLWGKVTYEEGTSGPLKVVEGVMMDDEYGVTIINPNEGVATTIGDKFVVRVDVQQVFMEDVDEDEDADV